LEQGVRRPRRGPLGRNDHARFEMLQQAVDERGRLGE
jgi:hypothetical protein